MLAKKSVTILIIIAVVLAGVAIATQFYSSDEIPTTAPITGNSINGGNVGINIIPSQVEDKLAGGEQS